MTSREHYDKLRDCAKDTSIRCYDTYCGTGYYILSRGLLSLMQENPGNLDHDVLLRAVIEGVVDGATWVEKEIAAGSKYYRSPSGLPPVSVGIVPRWHEAPGSA